MDDVLEAIHIGFCTRHWCRPPPGRSSVNISRSVRICPSSRRQTEHWTKTNRPLVPRQPHRGCCTEAELPNHLQLAMINVSNVHRIVAARLELIDLLFLNNDGVAHSLGWCRNGCVLTGRSGSIPDLRFRVTIRNFKSAPAHLVLRRERQQPCM